MNYLATLAVSLLFSLGCVAQTTTNDQFSLNVLAPSAEYEVAVGNNSTIDLNAGVGLAYHYSSMSGESFGIFPGFESQYRYYYNFNKRAEKGKKTSENSANYIAGIASITSGNPILGDIETIADYAGYVGPAWGLQRVYEKNFKLNLNLGLGLGFNDHEAYLSPLVSLQLGFKLGKGK